MRLAPQHFSRTGPNSRKTTFKCFKGFAEIPAIGRSAARRLKMQTREFTVAHICLEFVVFSASALSPAPLKLRRRSRTWTFKASGRNYTLVGLNWEVSIFALPLVRPRLEQIPRRLRDSWWIHHYICVGILSYSFQTLEKLNYERGLDTLIFPIFPPC